MSSRFALLLPLLLASACSPRARPNPAGDPTALQLLGTDPDLKSQRFSLLLDFESDNDRLFVSAGTIVSTRAHTGARALATPPGVTTINLPDLLLGRAFPAEWTLAGLHVRPAGAPARVVLKYVKQGRAVATRTTDCPADRWTALFVEIAATDPAPSLRADNRPGTLAIESPSPLLVDDVLLVDNSREYVPGPSHWTVRRRGYAILIDRPGVFHMTLPTPGASQQDGWTVDDATPLRARLSRAAGQVTMTVYNDGRAFRSDDSPPAVHGAVSVPGAQGRVDRNSPGDADNDGFNEARGAYRVIARPGTRHLDITLTPDRAALDRPILEIDHLPPGRVRATIEGRPATDIDRQGDTTVIIVPAKIERQTTINVSVE